MSSLSTLPKGDSAWLLRKSIQRIMQQVSVLETNIGSSTTGNSSNTQVIFNDAGTLRGDSGLTYNKTTDTLSVGSAIITGAATISGDLTVHTSTLKVDATNHAVGIGTVTPASYSASKLTVYTAANTLLTIGQATSYSNLQSNGYDFYINTNVGGAGSNAGSFTIRHGSSSAVQYNITSGVHTWQNVGGVAGTAMTLNSTGLGVGDSPATKIFARVTPPGAGQDGMRVSDGTRLIQMSISGSSYSYQGIGSNQNVIYASGNPLSILSDAQNLRLGTSSTSYLLLDTSGNVGIGGTPQAWNTSYKGVQVGLGAIFYTNAGTPNNGWLATNTYQDAANTTTFIGTGYGMHYRHLSGEHAWLTSTVSGSAGGAATMTQMMTLDASGKLNLGVTSPYNAARLTVQSAGGAGGISVAIQNDDDSYYAINFRNSSGTSCGSISCTTSSTSFNVSSDYRLKEAVQPLTGGLTRVNALKPSIYKWKVNGSTGEGFIAHELADVVPFAVTGEKDAVNADGSIKPQGVDLSKVVPVLVAAIQELTARVQTLEAK